MLALGDTPIAKLPNLPSNHQPNFAPDPESTLREVYVHSLLAALAYLPAAEAVRRLHEDQ